MSPEESVVEETIDEVAPFALNRAVATALTAAGATALRRWAGRRRPPASRLLRGALAGAGAAMVSTGWRAFRGEDLDLADALLLGAGRGVVYTAILDPVLPGPPALRGALAGAIEYMATPWGGAFGPLSSLTPAQKLPVVGALLEAGDESEDSFVSCVLYGLALGLLTGESD
jgi:hypothetical protein